MPISPSRWPTGYEITPQSHTCENDEQRGLSRAIRFREGEEIALSDIEIHLVEKPNDVQDAFLIKVL